jgi:hypothetical protein
METNETCETCSLDSSSGIRHPSASHDWKFCVAWFSMQPRESFMCTIIAYHKKGIHLINIFCIVSYNLSNNQTSIFTRRPPFKPLYVAFITMTRLSAASSYKYLSLTGLYPCVFHHHLPYLELKLRFASLIMTNSKSSLVSQVRAIAIVWPALATLVVVLRIMTRLKLLGKFGRNDWTILLALVWNISVESNENTSLIYAISFRNFF